MGRKHFLEIDEARLLRLPPSEQELIWRLLREATPDEDPAYQGRPVRFTFEETEEQHAEKVARQYREDGSIMASDLIDPPRRPR